MPVERMLLRIFYLLLLLFPASLVGQSIQLRDSIPLSTKDTVRLQEVSVSGNHTPKVSGMLTGDLKLNTELLQSVPALAGTVDVLKLMELTPSVRTSGDGSSNMYVRGGDAGQNLIIYDGVTTYTPGHMLGIFPLFNANHLSWVKMSKGAADAEYGNFISSVVEVNSRKTVSDQFWLKGNTGLLASQLTSYLPVSDRWGIYISGRKTYLDLILQPLVENQFSSSSSKETSIGYDFWDGNLTIVGNLNEKHSLSIDLMTGKDKLKITDRDIIIDGGMKWTNVLSSINLRSTFSDRLQLSQTVAFSHFGNKLNTAQDEMRIKLQSQIEDFSYKNKFSFSVARIPVNTGINYTYHQIKPHNLKLMNSGVVTNSVIEKEINAHDFSAFFSLTYNPLPKLSLKPVLRYNIFNSKTGGRRESKTFHSLDVRLSARYQLHENIFLRGNYSHNNQYVNKLTPSSVGLPTDFWIASTGELKPQQGDEVSLGYYHILLNGSIEFSADVYYRKMRNLTQFDYNFIENDNSSFVDKIFYGTGRAYGLELMLKKNFGRLSGWVGYTLSKSDRTFALINGGKSFPARYDRTHDFSATANYKFSSRWDLSLTQIYATGNTYTQPTSWYFINNLPVKEYTKYNNARMPDYNRTDIGVNYWLKKDCGFNFSIYNMFAIKNPVYVFMVIKQDVKNGNDNIELEMKKKNLYTIIPSISWNFKF